MTQLLPLIELLRRSGDELTWDRVADVVVSDGDVGSLRIGDALDPVLTFAEQNEVAVLDYAVAIDAGESLGNVIAVEDFLSVFSQAPRYGWLECGAMEGTITALRYAVAIPNNARSRSQSEADTRSLRQQLAERLTRRSGPPADGPRKHKKSLERPLSWHRDGVTYTLGDGVAPIVDGNMGSGGGERVVVLEVRDASSRQPLWSQLSAS